MASITKVLKHAWNIFKMADPNKVQYEYGSISSHGHNRQRVWYSRNTEQSIVGPIYNRIAIDVAVHEIRHVRLDEQDRYSETISSGLNECLTLSPNVDQSALAFIMDAVLTMCENGHVAIVPIETTVDINNSNAWDITDMRIGIVTEWFPKKVRVNVYDDETGERRDIITNKSNVAIVYNPFYAVMNETNSTLQRLLRKLALLDSMDEAIGAGKLDLILQLPYQVKSDSRKKEAEQRRRAIEDQMTNSRIGVAYIDGVEKITQLNRPVENTFISQVETLTNNLWNQLGMSVEIFNGTADAKIETNYHNKTVYPIIKAITDEMRRKFLTKTARTQKQTIMYFRDLFKYVTISELAEIGDKLTRNEVMSSNDIRTKMGMPPSKDPKADELRNKNIQAPTEGESPTEVAPPIPEQERKV